MAHPSRHRLCSPGIVRFLLVLLGFFLICFLFRPPLIFRRSSDVLALCPPCSCDCSSEIMLPMPTDIANVSLADCAKHDPEMNEELKKDIITLLSEEINLQKNVTSDSLEHTKALLTDAKKTSSHYQREAEKCNTGMETCEAARERAEASLTEERKLSALWETRAREYGWKD